MAQHCLTNFQKRAKISQKSKDKVVTQHSMLAKHCNPDFNKLARLRKKVRYISQKYTLDKYTFRK